MGRAGYDAPTPRFGTRRMDRISADDWAAFIRDLRAIPLAEGSIESVLKSARGVYSYAARRLDWSGRDTLALLDRAERPKPSDKVKRRLFSEAELAAVLQAAVGQNRKRTIELPRQLAAMLAEHKAADIALRERLPDPVRG